MCLRKLWLTPLHRYAFCLTLHEVGGLAPANEPAHGAHDGSGSDGGGALAVKGAVPRDRPRVPPNLLSSAPPKYLGQTARNRYRCCTRCFNHNSVP